ncbi:hypothetical protein D3C87_104380 [compost metagenome]
MIRGLIFVPLLILSLFVVIFLWKFGAGLSSGFNTIESWGQAGDFFGGLLNPILAYFSFIAVIFTVLQNQRALSQSQEELKLSREEMARSTHALQEQNQQIRLQRLETTYFELLKHLGELTEDIVVDREKLGARGIKIESSFFPHEGKLAMQELLKIFAEIRRNYPDKDAVEIAQTFFDHVVDLVDFYFDSLNVILQFLITSKLEGTPFYKDLLVAQMSTDELLLLFYYSMRKQSEVLRGSVIHSQIMTALHPSELLNPEKDSALLALLVNPRP